MSIQSDPPKVTRVTTVANLSKTEAYPVERSDRGEPVPQTRPDPSTQPPRPRPMVVPPQRRVPANPLATHHAGLAGQLPRRQPPRRVPARIIPTTAGRENYPGDPTEGVGPGTPPPGGTKLR